MPGIRNGRKRPAVAVSDDDDDDDEQSEVSYESPAIKRARPSRDASDSPAPTNGTRQAQNGRHNGDEYAKEAHQPGSLVRVKLTNFVTYTAAEFQLGPSLNMIIGPNGTGKSTLVCAICLGLGWSPQHLGRAKELGEFVKHGHDMAEIEIELAAAEHRKSNPIVRRIIRKEGNKSAFYINDRSSSQKDVISLARSFSIQIDNLCQFLPQDRVVEFARLDPVSLLRETQRAAAPEHMVQWHDQLKALRTEEKTLEVQQQNESGHLKALQAKQNATREDVERFNQRQELVAKSRTIEKCRPIINMKILRTEVDQVRSELQASKEELEQYKAEVEPAQQAQQEMETYRDQVDSVAKARKERFDAGKASVEKLATKIDAEQQSLGNFTAEIEAERQADKKRKLDIRRIEGDISRLKSAQESIPVQPDQAAFAARNTECRTHASAAQREIVEIEARVKDIRAKVFERQAILKRKQGERDQLNTQSGQQGTVLKKLSLHTYQAWEWLEANMASLGLKDKAYAPPILSCSVPDSQYASIVESQLRRVDLMAITCTNRDDAKIVSDKLLGRKDKGGLGLHNIVIRTCPNGRASYHSPLTEVELKALMLDSWISDHIQGPDPVLAMLCDSTKLHRAAYTPRPVSNEQFNAIQKKISKWVSGKEFYQVTTRREYNASSTSVTQVRNAQFFTDQPVDTEDKRRLDEEMVELQRDIDSLRSDHNEARTEFADATRRRTEAEEQRRAVLSEHEQLKRAFAEWQGLPTKIAVKEDELANIRGLSADTYSRIKLIRTQSEKAALKVAALTIEHARALVQLRALYESHVEAEIRLIEANSEVDGYKADNRGIQTNLQQKEAEVKELQNRLKDKRAAHGRQHKIALQLTNNVTQEEKEMIKGYSELQTIEALDDEIAAIAARLDLMAEGNPNAIKAFEKREQEIEALQSKLDNVSGQLESTRASIAGIREQWEPELDALVAKISDGFSHNFQQIGCAGQVDVYKDEDFENWSIQIQVRFREGESLSILDSHRQSGGERAVSTIFYLMALQDLARSPFRVVDEINQGMDPRNERMVHERMVDIACRERTSQYFLITPKLLNDLKFHPKMTVHCIASGEHMPDQRAKLDFKEMAQMALTVRKRGRVAA
ncbi:P-loop containing nucleoside triphosphate hydrolase protein [Lentithecium fluviatile CBS 122367]|uniref:Structural maintenance of chromosomes protein 5 n=1 Tax=Lentithecium fluviatile CBS 122367 TaxID=1168545 RepID=A0A6G1JFK0_9PLEO|nr:P-loop containing nucleoside triphosphate hydrolase protein [Lentithecium fluviatile CBS 122367]